MRTTTKGESSKDSAAPMAPKRVPLKQLLACVSAELSKRCQQPCFRLCAVHPGDGRGAAPTWDVEATAPVRRGGWLASGGGGYLLKVGTPALVYRSTLTFPDQPLII